MAEADRKAEGCPSTARGSLVGECLVRGLAPDGNIFMSEFDQPIGVWLKVMQPERRGGLSA
jgi:hypothetical protein